MFLNQFADQFVPILALVALRVVVGVGDSLLKRFSKPKKGAMQARHPILPSCMMRGAKCCASVAETSSVRVCGCWAPPARVIFPSPKRARAEESTGAMHARRSRLSQHHALINRRAYHQKGIRQLSAKLHSH